MASSERIFKVLDEPVVIESPVHPTAGSAPAAGHIVFETEPAEATAAKNDQTR